MITPDPRPVFLDLLRIRLPVAGITSIGHRIAGMLLFFALPWGIYLFDLSLRGPDGYAQVIAMMTGWTGQALYVVLLWALLHHLLAGLRLLLIDLDIGVGRAMAQRSARWVNYVAPVLALLGGVVI